MPELTVAALADHYSVDQSAPLLAPRSKRSTAQQRKNR